MDEKAKAYKNEQRNKALKQLDEMKEDLDNFSRTFESKKFQKALKTYHKLENGGYLELNEISAVKVNSFELFKKGFKFENMCQNEDAAALLEELDIAQNNLNNNLTNGMLLDSFVKVAQKAQKTLKNKYNETWVDPKDQVQNEEAADEN